MTDFPPTSDPAAAASQDSTETPPEESLESGSGRGAYDGRHAERAPELIRRLKSVEGHVRGIQKMVAEDAYCIDLLRQIKAVRAALDRVGQIALETHLETCVTDGLRSDAPAEREKIIGEILEIFDARTKR